jgi:hypothetical protein
VVKKECRIAGNRRVREPTTTHDFEDMCAEAACSSDMETDKQSKKGKETLTDRPPGVGRSVGGAIKKCGGIAKWKDSPVTLQ